MGRLIRRILVLSVIAWGAVTLLRRTGLLGGNECGATCDCSFGAAECRCGHATCLAPAA